jgi:hypothetical protein
VDERVDVVSGDTGPNHAAYGMQGSGGQAADFSHVFDLASSLDVYVAVAKEHGEESLVIT